MDGVTAIILGGGRGTRLYPLTLRRAKPAVGFAGKYRIIDIPLSNCINSGIKRVFVLTHSSCRPASTGTSCRHTASTSSPTVSSTSLPPNRPTRGATGFRGLRMQCGSEIRDSLLCEGSRIIKARVVDSVVGVRSIIREGTTLNQVVLLGEDFYEGEQLLSESREGGDEPPMGIGRNCLIERAIIDKNVRIGDGVVIREKPRAKARQTEQYWFRDGITVIPKGAVIPPGTEI